MRVNNSEFLYHFLIRGTTRYLLHPLAIGVLIAVVSSGCGDDDGGANKSKVAQVVIPWGPSAIEYVDKANGVCKKTTRQMRRSVTDRYGNVSKGPVFDEAAKNIFLPSLQIEFDDISYLGAPVADKPQIEDMLIALQRAVFEGQEQTVSSRAQLVALFSKFNQLAGEYKLKACLVSGHSFEAGKTHQT